MRYLLIVVVFLFSCKDEEEMKINPFYSRMGVVTRTVTDPGPPVDPPDPPVGVNRLYVLAGQSNMDGRGTVAELPVEMTGVFSKCFVYSSPGGWQNIEPGVVNGTLNNNTVRVGPLIPFAYYESIKHPDDNLYFIIYAQGGTNLSDHWLPPSGVAYSKLINNRYDPAMTALAGLGVTIDVKECFIYYQGEQDSNNLTYANAYYENEFDLFTEVFTETGFDLVLDIKVSTSYPYNTTVNTAKTNNAARINSTLIETSDINTTSELHLTTAQYITLGERLSDTLP